MPSRKLPVIDLDELLCGISVPPQPPPVAAAPGPVQQSCATQEEVNVSNGNGQEDDDARMSDCGDSSELSSKDTAHKNTGTKRHAQQDRPKRAKESNKRVSDDQEGPKKKQRRQVQQETKQDNIENCTNEPRKQHREAAPLRVEQCRANRASIMILYYLCLAAQEEKEAIVTGFGELEGTRTTCDDYLESDMDTLTNSGGSQRQEDSGDPSKNRAVNDQQESAMKRGRHDQEVTLNDKNLENVFKEPARNNRGATPPYRLPPPVSEIDDSSSIGMDDTPGPNDLVFGATRIRELERTNQFLDFAFKVVCEYYKAGGNGSSLDYVLKKTIPLWIARGSNAYSKSDQESNKQGVVKVSKVEFWETCNVFTVYRRINEAEVIQKINHWFNGSDSRRLAIRESRNSGAKALGNNDTCKFLKQQLASGDDINLSSSMVSQQLE